MSVNINSKKIVPMPRVPAHLLKNVVTNSEIEPSTVQRSLPQPPSFPKPVQAVPITPKSTPHLPPPRPPVKQPTPPTSPKETVQLAASTFEPLVPVSPKETIQVESSTPPQPPRTLSAIRTQSQGYERNVGGIIITGVAAEPAPRITLPVVSPTRTFRPPTQVSLVDERTPKSVELSLDRSAPLEQRIERYVKKPRPIAPDIVKGMRRTKLFKAVVVSAGFTLAALFGVPTLVASLVGLGALLAATPPGWIILGAAVAGFVIGYLLSSNKGTADKTEAEIIPVSNKQGICLQAFPNRFYNDAEKLAKNNVGVVLSCNKPSEREHCGTRIPYSYEDFANLGIAYCPMDVDDRELLTQEQLELGARVINKHLSAGENICISGEAGRQAYAAYLLRYSPTRTVETALEMAGVPNSRNDVLRELVRFTTATRASRIYNEEAAAPVSGTPSDADLNPDRLIIS